MSISSETILSNQAHPGDSSVQTVTGDKFRGDGFYNRSDGLHTVQVNLSNFQGTIALEATLATTPVDLDWFTLTETIITNDTGSIIKNFTGNYVWVRVKVSNWTAGSISSVLMNH